MPVFDDGFCLRSVGSYTYSTDATVPWLRRMLGDYAVHILFYDPAGDRDGTKLRRARSLFPEAEIWGWPDRPAANLPRGIKPWPKDRHWMI